MKRMIAMTMALAALLGLCSCSAERQREPSLYEEISIMDANESDSHHEPDETDEDIFPDEREPEEKEPEEKKKTYESETLIIRGITDQYKDEFVSLLDKTGSKILLRGNKVVTYQNADYSWITEDDDVQKIIPLSDNYGYVDSQGRFHVREDGTEFICADIRGEVFHEFFSSFSGTLVVFSKDSEGYLYVNGYRASGAKESYDNDRLYIKDNSTDIYYDRVDEINVVTSSTTYFFAEIGEVKLYDTFTSIYKFDEKVQIWASGDLERADKIFDYGYTSAFTSPLYSATGELFKLFYENGWDGDEMPIMLPDGYTVEDIEKVAFGDTTVVMFRDGSVYTAELTHSIYGVELTENTELSAYGREGKIKDIFLSSYRSDSGASIIVLMDDNVQYEVVEAESEE